MGRTSAICRSTFVALMAVVAMGVVTAPAFASGKPLVETKPATNIAEQTATLNGVVNPNGAETKYHFEYGTTIAYGKKTVEVSAGSGITNLEEAQKGAELSPETTYHFRVVATNSNGTSDGADEVLKTAVKSKAGLPEFVASEGSKLPIALEGSLTTGQSAFSGSFVLNKCYNGYNSTGEITGAKTLSLTIELHGCEQEGTECHTKGYELGTEVISGSASLVYISKSKKEVGMLLTQPESLIKCGGREEPIRGTILAPISPLNAKTSELGLKFTGNGEGTPTFSSYENEKGEVEKAKFEWYTAAWKRAAFEMDDEVKLTAGKSLTVKA